MELLLGFGGDLVHAAAWVVLVLAVTPVAQWTWHAVLHEGVASVATGALIAVCLLPFAVVWEDLR